VDVSKSLSEFANEAFAATYLEVAKAYKDESFTNKYLVRQPGETKAILRDRGAQAGAAGYVAGHVGAMGLNMKGHGKAAIAADAGALGSGIYAMVRGHRAANKWRTENGYAPRHAITGMPKKDKKSDSTPDGED